MISWELINELENFLTGECQGIHWTCTELVLAQHVGGDAWAMLKLGIETDTHTIFIAISG